MINELIIYLAVIAALLYLAGYQDLKNRTIPNWIPTAMAILGVVSVFAFHESMFYLAMLVNLAFVGMILLLYRAGAFAAGDAKICIATVIAFPYALVGFYTFIIALPIGVILLLLKVKPVPFITAYATAFLLFIIGGMII